MSLPAGPTVGALIAFNASPDYRVHPNGSILAGGGENMLLGKIMLKGASSPVRSRKALFEF